MSQPLALATTNTGKLALLQELLDKRAAHRWRLGRRDPGDAEYSAPVGYTTAAQAKAAAVGTVHGLALGHDSGYEFDCLAGRPGPLTARWLAQRDVGEVIAALLPGSTVRVVHCLALWRDGTVFTTRHDDLRSVVPALPPSMGGPLPLTDLVEGPREALRRCVHDVLKHLEPATGQAM